MSDTWREERLQRTNRLRKPTLRQSLSACFASPHRISGSVPTLQTFGQGQSSREMKTNPGDGTRRSTVGPERRSTVGRVTLRLLENMGLKRSAISRSSQAAEATD